MLTFLALESGKTLFLADGIAFSSLPEVANELEATGPEHWEVLQEENSQGCSRDPCMGARAGLSVYSSQRQLVLIVGFTGLGPLNLPRETLEGAFTWDSLWGVLLSIYPGKARFCWGFGVCFFMALLPLPKFTSLIFYLYSVFKQITNFRYT